MQTRNIGAYIAPRAGINPTNSAGGTTSGAAIDRLGYHSAVLMLMVGSPSGAPTSFTVDAKLQESADGSTGWTDVSGGAVSQITSANSQAEVNLNLVGLKRYIRAVVTVSFTGGTSPAIPVVACVVLGYGDSLPI